MCPRQERRLFELLAAALVALGPACRRQPALPPAAPAKTPPPTTPSRAVDPVDAGLSMPERIQRFLTEWTSAQARGDLAAYDAFYHSEFKGWWEHTRPLNRAAWMEEAKQELRCTSKWEITQGPPASAATAGARKSVPISYRMRRTCGPALRSEHGEKRLTFAEADGRLLLIDETTTIRRPGWLDDAEAAELSPRNARSCAPVAFAPGRDAQLVVIRGGDDYVSALTAAAKWRAKSVPAQIVMGRDFPALNDDAFWLVLDGGTDAATLRGRWPKTTRVIDGRLAANLPITNLRLVGRRLFQQGDQSLFHSTHVVATASGMYFEHRSGLWFVPFVRNHAQRAPLDAGIPRLRYPGCTETTDASDTEEPSLRLRPLAVDLAPLGEARISRVTTSDGDGLVLDDGGRWYQLEGCQLRPFTGQVASTQPTESTEVAGWGYRFKPGDSDGAGILVCERGGKTVFQIPLFHGGIQSGDWELHAGGGHLALVRKHLLLLFEVMPEMLPPRLVRVCGVHEGPDPKPGRRTGYLVFDGAVVSTDRAGAFDVWTSRWGNLDVAYWPFGDNDCPAGDVPNPVSDDLETFGGRQATIHYGPYCQEGGD